MNKGGELADRVAGEISTKPRTSLFRKYALLFAVLVSAVLIANGLVEIYFSYQENKTALLSIQREKAETAAAVIERFVKEVEAQVGWTMHAGFLSQSEALAQRRIDYFRLLRQAPAITEIVYLDAAGREQIFVSRFALNVIGSAKDYSGDLKFRTARAQGRYLSSVYFRKESEPYLTLGLGGRGRDKGVTVAEINLKFILDVVSRIKAGGEGRAFVVDSNGLLIAHPDISLVLRKTDLSNFPQVAVARAQLGALETDEVGTITRGLDGQEVLSAHAPIISLDWLVFVETPLSEVFAPLYDSLTRTVVLLVVGIVLSVFTGLLLARRMVLPIRALQRGAARIGGGELVQKIEIGTGDELEDLADQFNQMGARLHESYATLEHKVEERTGELSEALEQLEALVAVGQTINSTLDLEGVLNAILVHACQLGDAGGGAIYVLNNTTGEFQLQATHGMTPDFIEAVQGISIRLGETLVGRCAERREVLQAPDIEQETDHPLREAFRRAGVQALLAVPLLREQSVIGALVLRRRRRGPFAEPIVDLMQTFASQSALAIQNANLFQEIEAKSRDIEIASRHKSQFLANMSHELRTPLNAIQGYIELILDEIYGPPLDKVREVLERVQANGHHLLGLINDVLDLSKIEAGELELLVNDYSMSEVVQTVVSATESLAAEKNLALDVALPSSLPTGTGDERRIVQVLLNLVGNAIKFTDEGEVEIRVEARNGMFEVQVADTGPGIAAAQQERIFEEFHQVDDSSTKEKGGTGLGLAIAKRIIEMHGGRIWLDSTVGQGSTFSFCLPLHVEPPQIPS